jgi:hypothetical protein
MGGKTGGKTEFFTFFPSLPTVFFLMFPKKKKKKDVFSFLPTTHRWKKEKVPQATSEPDFEFRA